MDDQNQTTNQNPTQDSTGPNVLGAAPTMGDSLSTPSTGLGDTGAASPAGSTPSTDSSMAGSFGVPPSEAAPVASTEATTGDPVMDSLKRIEDKVDAIATKVGA